MNKLFDSKEGNKRSQPVNNEKMTDISRPVHDPSTAHDLGVQGRYMIRQGHVL